MASILGDIGIRSTPQRERTPGRTDEVKNSAGGYVFGLDDWARLQRFLILGVDGGTYYATGRELALQNVEVVERCLKEDGKRVVDTAVNVSVSGKAPNNDPALFVLACAASCDDPETRRYALANLGDVARIGTHLFHFVQFVQSRRGWGRGLTSAISAWYTDKRPEDVAYQMVKYRQRDGWSHRDVLRKAHPKAATSEMANVLRFAAGKHDADTTSQLPQIVQGFIKAQDSDDADETAALVREYKLPREAVKPEHLAGGTVWQALLDGGMPMGALIRNLGVLTNRDLLGQGSDNAVRAANRLTEAEEIRKARIHPIAILNALMTYRKGYSRGSLTWTPNPKIVDALDAAFYLSFDNIEATGKRIMLAIDCSASMTWQPCNGASFDAREGAAAMAMVTAAAEKDVIITGFCDGGLVMLDLSPRRRLDDNIGTIGRQRASGTDCALPMIGATQQNLNVDVFQIYTDSETNSGAMKPTQALDMYRQKMQINAKLVVIGMTSTGFTIADPTDPNTLDVVGFDTSTPEVISAFSREYS